LLGLSLPRGGDIVRSTSFELAPGCEQRDLGCMRRASSEPLTSVVRAEDGGPTPFLSCAFVRSDGRRSEDGAARSHARRAASVRRPCARAAMCLVVATRAGLGSTWCGASSSRGRVQTVEVVCAGG
jgi:hypothetical protein